MEETMTAFSEQIEAALILAARAHHTQTRKGGDSPYIVHPVHVCLILFRHGFSEEVAIAGLLHDVVEDQDVPLTRIGSEFGPEVTGIVAALTERKRDGDAERPWEERKREALVRLESAGAGAAAVKAADVVHNAHSLTRDLRHQGSAVWEHYKRGPDSTLWYYRRAAEIVRGHLGRHPLVDELEDAIWVLEQAIAGIEAG
jgi:(p)ppGpp synthase/HD superfamily hydrolase